MKKTLTLQYVLQQIAFWAAAAGIVSFATAFLLEKGFSAFYLHRYHSYKSFFLVSFPE